MKANEWWMLIPLYLLLYRAIELDVNDDLKIWNIDDVRFTSETCLKNWGKWSVLPASVSLLLNAGWFVTHRVKDLSSTFGQVDKLERMGWKGWKFSKVFFVLILCLFLGFVLSIISFLCFFVCVFQKFRGLQFFPETFRCNLSLYGCENFSDSDLNDIFESKNCRFPFSTKNSITRGVKCEKLSFRKS